MKAPERTIVLQIALAARLLRKRYDERARIFGLTRAQGRIIGAIRFNPGITQRELAGLLEVGSVTASRLVDRVERDGWIERRSDPTDRRVHRLYASPAAGALYERMTALSEEEERMTLAGLDEAQRRVLSDALDLLLRNLCAESNAAGVEAGDPDD